MSHQIITSELLNELSDEQQQMLVGGADFELSGSNFGSRRSALIGRTTSGPHGSTATSIGINSAVNTSAQDFLGLGGNLPTGVGALGASPVGGENGTGNGGDDELGDDELGDDELGDDELGDDEA